MFPTPFRPGIASARLLPLILVLFLHHVVSPPVASAHIRSVSACATSTAGGFKNPKVWICTDCGNTDVRVKAMNGPVTVWEDWAHTGQDGTCGITLPLNTEMNRIILTLTPNCHVTAPGSINILTVDLENADALASCTSDADLRCLSLSTQATSCGSCPAPITQTPALDLFGTIALGAILASAGVLILRNRA